MVSVRIRFIVSDWLEVRRPRLTNTECVIEITLLNNEYYCAVCTDAESHIRRVCPNTFGDGMALPNAECRTALQQPYLEFKSPQVLILIGFRLRKGSFLFWLLPRFLR